MNEVDEIQAILDKKFSGLHMDARIDCSHPQVITCFLHLGSHIFLEFGGYNEGAINDRILVMLKDLKKFIEVDIERLEK